MTVEERIELQKRILLSKMESVTLDSSDYELIIAALSSGNKMKIECGLIALKRTFNVLFV